ncbi:hypothetical protein BaRGS_00020306 [Batillaria attramentaria]|uniref:Secreted protein n=1 Tax=Batillaria attramentaria TaxID=370345 RepID=A0ABD0KN34_9CAEN
MGAPEKIRCVSIGCLATVSYNVVFACGLGAWGEATIAVCSLESESGSKSDYRWRNVTQAETLDEFLFPVLPPPVRSTLPLAAVSSWMCYMRHCNCHNAISHSPGHTEQRAFTLFPYHKTIRWC